METVGKRGGPKGWLDKGIKWLITGKKGEGTKGRKLNKIIAHLDWAKASGHLLGFVSKEGYNL